MKDPDRIENEVKLMSIDRDKWLMKSDFADCNEKQFECKMEKKYKYLKESSKTLFKNVLENKVDQKNFQFLLQMMRQVTNKQKTPEQADMVVGKVFAEKYIDPLVNNINESKNNE